MSNEPPRISSVPGVPSSRRSHAHEALLFLAQDLISARFVLARALSKLPTHEVLDLLDEVDETLETGLKPVRPGKTTLRDEDL